MRTVTEPVEVAKKGTRLERRRRSMAGSVIVGLLLFAILAAVGAAFAGSPDAYDTIGALVLTPVIIFATLPFLRRQAESDGDDRLYRFLAFALLVKLAGALLRYFVGTDVYQSRGDAFAYHEVGVELSGRFRSGSFDVGGRQFSDSAFLEILTGIVYTIIGPTKIGGFIFFSWLGFIGLACFYRAFTIAVPEGRKRTYARLLFFLPSLVFWPSSIGKESWMTLCIGVAALGAARLLSGKTVRGLVITGIGLWSAGIVRPHVAGLLAVSIAAGFALRPTPPRFRSIAPVAKVVSLAAVALVAGLLVVQANEFLRKSHIDTSEGIGSVLESVADRTGQGGSQYAPPIFDSPARAPAAVVTVLYRPTLIEAHNSQALASAAEGTFLLLYSVWRIRWGFAALQLMRKRSYVTFSIVLVGAFIFVLSSFSNFGLLTRERIQLLPMYLVLFSIPPLASREVPKARLVGGPQ